MSQSIDRTHVLGTVQTLAPSSDFKATGPHGATSDSRLYALGSSPNAPNNHDIDNVRGGGSGIGYGEENSKVLDVDPENAKDFHRAYRKVGDWLVFIEVFQKDMVLINFFADSL